KCAKNKTKRCKDQANGTSAVNSILPSVFSPVLCPCPAKGINCVSEILKDTIKHMKTAHCDFENNQGKAIEEEKKCIAAIISMSFEGKSKDYDLEDLAMTVVKMDMSLVTNGYVQISSPEVFSYDTSVETWIPMEPFLNASGVQGKVAVVSYPASAVHLFLANQSNVLVMSEVIRVEVFGRDIKDISNLLSINFTVNNSTAVSLAVKKEDMKIDEQNWRILSYISYVGSGLSLFFCAISVFVYIVNRSPNVNYSNSIHVSLSAALLLLNMSYLFSEWTATLGIESVCVFVAVAIEYSLLCCFFWLAIEALHLYLLMVKVLNTCVQHYMTKLSLFGWGVPAVLVGVSLSVYDVLPLYGTKNITLSDSQTNSKICWITNNTFLYGMNLTCLSLMFLFNMTILLTMICQIIKLQCWGTKHSRLTSGKNICIVLGLTYLLGIPWGLAFFSYGYTNYPVIYLFCICNSLQGSLDAGRRNYESSEGLFMFLWICTTTRSTRCLERYMRNCTKKPGRLQNPNLHLMTVNSSYTARVDTNYGHAIHIPSEALLRSIRVQANISSYHVDLKVFVLNASLFEVSSASVHENEIVRDHKVLGVWLGEKPVQNLSHPITMVFAKDNQNPGSVPDHEDTYRLTYITYIGSSFSVVFTVIIIVLFLRERKTKAEHSVIIHTELAGSLLLLHITFLASSLWSETERVCQVLGLILHWALLAVFTWTAIEGVHLYLLLVRIFNIYIRRYLLKLSLVGWGIPTIIVMICGVAGTYGKYTITEKDSNSTAICWVTSKAVSDITVKGYLGLVLLFNIAILAVVVVKLHKLRARDFQSGIKVNRIWKDWATILGLSLVLGLPWGLAFSTHGPLSLIGVYIFTILNSFQGE
ncbi:hypothetical protein P4O66_006727, partial [Electrophorus voltai]